MRDWNKAIASLDFAYQAIVNSQNGVTYGYEALLRHVEEAGFPSIDSVFNDALADGCLVQVELGLRNKAMTKYVSSGLHTHCHLFYNIDNRVLIQDFASTSSLLEKHSLRHRMCFEVSEKHPISYTPESIQQIRNFRAMGLTLAVDDYGTGFSGLQQLYYIEPNFIKIDRFFIQDICRDIRKKHFVTSLVQSAHLLGSLVIAEGVETEKEFFECVAIGCDLVQGYLIHRPTVDIQHLQRHFPSIQDMALNQQRQKKSDQHRLEEYAEWIEPVSVQEGIYHVFSRFRDEIHNFIPVVNHYQEPVGVVRENQFKSYAYSNFGRELIQNTSRKQPLSQIIEPTPVVDLHMPAEKILEIYSLNRGLDCILLTENLRYRGFISASSLLNILHEKNLNIARDQNPLTRLPGNTIIFEYLMEALSEPIDSHSLVYLDFDRFKMFNDFFGFRLGDRMIQLFAGILKEHSKADLIAHIGGDDFFVAYRNTPIEQVENLVIQLQEKFVTDAEAFYSNNENINHRVGVSCAVLHLLANHPPLAHDLFSSWIAQSKKIAKNNGNHIHIQYYPAPAQNEQNYCMPQQIHLL